MIDSHCHLAGEEFAADLDAVVARARERGCRRRAGDPRRRATTAEAARAGRCASRVAGGAVRGRDPSAPGRAASPTTSTRRSRRLDARSDARTTRVRARRDRARLPLRLLAARRPAGGLPRASSSWRASGDLPVIIHTREATDDTFRILRERRGRGCAACFTASRAAMEMARAALDLGVWLSFAGIVTFPKAGGAARGRPDGAGRPAPGRDRFARISRRCRSAASATSRRSSRRSSRALADGARRPPRTRLPRQSTANFARCSVGRAFARQ